MWVINEVSLQTEGNNRQSKVIFKFTVICFWSLKTLFDLLLQMTQVWIRAFVLVVLVVGLNRLKVSGKWGSQVEWERKSIPVLSQLCPYLVPDPTPFRSQPHPHCVTVCHNIIPASTNPIFVCPNTVPASYLHAPNTVPMCPKHCPSVRIILMLICHQKWKNADLI